MKASESYLDLMTRGRVAPTVIENSLIRRLSQEKSESSPLYGRGKGKRREASKELKFSISHDFKEESELLS